VYLIPMTSRCHTFVSHLLLPQGCKVPPISNGGTNHSQLPAAGTLLDSQVVALPLYCCSGHLHLAFLCSFNSTNFVFSSVSCFTKVAMRTSSRHFTSGRSVTRGAAVIDSIFCLLALASPAAAQSLFQLQFSISFPGLCEQSRLWWQVLPHCQHTTQLAHVALHCQHRTAQLSPIHPDFSDTLNTKLGNNQLLRVPQKRRFF
jgi:hypothetical protein